MINTNIIYTILITLLQSNNTPTQIAILITALSVIITIHTNANSSSPWLSAILLLTYTGGMMILFIYAASVTNTENSSTNPLTVPIIIATTIVLSSNKEAEIPTSNPNTMFNQIIPIVITILLAYSLIVITNIIENPQNTINVTN